MASWSIAVLGNNPRTYTEVCRALDREGFDLMRLEHVADLPRTGHRPSLLILDLDACAEGASALESLRDHPYIPVLALSSSQEESDRILGLELGADDYLPKPFSPRELLARVRALLRRVEAVASQHDVPSRIVAGAVELDPARQELVVDGVVHQLTMTETALLKLLMENRGRVLSRDQILNQVWGEEFVAHSRVVDAYISTLRRKFFPGAGKSTIQSVRGAGYRFEGGWASRHASGSTREKLLNLPAHPTPFFGRRAEREKIAARLGDPSCRLLTLVGPGGVGKTRLAFQCGQEAQGNFEQGVCAVSLARVASPNFLVSAVAGALRFSFYEGGDPKEELLRYLHEKKILLILDNAEHILEDVASLVGEILQAARRVKVMATSRERLRLRDEIILEIEGMPVSGNSLEENDSVRFFLECAQRVNPNLVLGKDDLPIVDQICRLVDGLPLGIELAASWLRTLSCQTIAEETSKSRDFLSSGLRDVPARHQGLRTVFEWSWQLLSGQEQDCFKAMAAFRGTFSRQAAEAVAGANFPLLRSLVDKSMVRHHREERYEVLEVLRKYAEEKLASSPAELHEVLYRHASHYLEFLSERETDLVGPKQMTAMGEIERELGNIRQAWSRAVEARDDALLEKSTEAWYLFHERTCRHREGAEGLGEAARATFLLPSTKARLQAREGVLLLWQSNYEKGELLLNESLAVFRSQQMASGEAFCLDFLGVKENIQGNPAYAEKLMAESLALYRQLRDRNGVARVLNHLGIVSNVLGNLGKARAFLEESLAICAELGDRHRMTRALGNLGVIHNTTGEYEEAVRCFQECLDICTRMSDRSGQAHSLVNLGVARHFLGDYQAAHVLHQEGLTMFRELGDPLFIAETLVNMAGTELALEEIGQARSCLAEAFHLSLEMHAIPVAVSALVIQATLLLKEKRNREAAEILSLVIHHHGSPAPWRKTAESLLPDLEFTLSNSELAQAWERGKRAKLEDAIRAFDLTAWEKPGS